jgi:hypothetical protein
MSTETLIISDLIDQQFNFLEEAESGFFAFLFRIFR